MALPTEPIVRQDLWLPFNVGVRLQTFASDNANILGDSGEYWVGDQNLRFGRHVLLAGRGARHLLRPGEVGTRLIHSGYKQSALGCAFELNHGVVIRDIDLECRTIQGQQNQVVGFQGTGLVKPPPGFDAASDATVYLMRMGIYGRTFGGPYCWGGFRNRVYGFKIYVEVGQFAVLAGGGSGDDAQYIEMCLSDLVVDFDRLIGAGGDQGMNACGFAAQGGRSIMYGGSIRVRGGKNAERAVGAWATKFPATPPAPKPDWKYAFPYLTLVNVDCKVDGNGCSGPVFDAIGDLPDAPPLRIIGGRGSGKNGAWRVKGNVEVIDAPKEVFA